MFSKLIKLLFVTTAAYAPILLIWWIISFYSPSEIEKHKQRLITLGIKESKIDLVVDKTNI